MAKSLMLGDDERKALAGHARDLRLLASRFERHVQQNITDDAAAKYVNEARAILNVIAARTGGDR